MAGRLAWLTERPIAHRGLHDRALGVVENTASAVARAIDNGFGIEVDVQATADGHAVVFHDDTLDRLTEAHGPVAAMTLAELKRVTFRETADRFWTLDDCLDLVAGRRALTVEVKSSFRGDLAVAEKVATIVGARGGPVVVESFDPRVLRIMRRLAPKVPRGVVGEAFGDADPHWAHLTGGQRRGARNLLHWPLTRPDFLSWRVRDLDCRTVRFARRIGTPVTAWTVRTPEDRASAAVYADQIVFEGFMP